MSGSFEKAPVQFHCDVATREHDAGVARDRERSEIVKGGHQRESVADHRTQRLAKIERGNGVKPVEGLVQYHPRVASRERKGDRDPLPHTGRAVANPAVEQCVQTERLAQWA